MIDASPLIVRKLRHHAFHITGVRPYDYRNKRDGREENFEARLAALRAIGGDGAARARVAGARRLRLRHRRPVQCRHAEVLRGAHRNGARRECSAPYGTAKGRSSARSARGGAASRTSSRRCSLAAPTSSSISPSCSCSRPRICPCFSGPDSSSPAPRRSRRPTGGATPISCSCRTRCPARVDAAPRSHRQHGVVPGNDRHAGARLRGDGGHGGLSAAVQPEPRALPVQHGAGQRQRGAVRCVPPHGSAGSRDRLHGRDEEAAEAGSPRPRTGISSVVSPRHRRGEPARPRRARRAASLGAGHRRRECPASCSA